MYLRILVEVSNRKGAKTKRVVILLMLRNKEILSRYSDAHIYKEAYTGTTTDRPVFNEVIRQMQENRYACSK